ncbi:hypothetical protein ACGFJ5_04840 [Micromonospora echinaurantiaca]
MTDSLPGFTTLLVRLRLAERAVATGYLEPEDTGNGVLVWEQMAG